MRADGGEAAVEGAERGSDQRLLREITGVGDEIAGGEVVGAVGDDVVLPDDRKRVLRGQSLD